VETLWYKTWSWLYLSNFLRCCWGFNLVVMFRCGDSAGLSGCCGEWVNVQSVGQERNAYRRTLLWLVQYETRGRYLSFCCKNFFLNFFNYGFMFTCTFSSTFQPLCCRGNNMRPARQCRRLCHDQSEVFGFGVWQVLSKCS